MADNDFSEVEKGSAPIKEGLVPTAKPWYKTRAFILSCVVIGLVVIGAVIAAGVLYASYVQGQPDALPDEALSCTSGCYTQQEIAEMRAPWDQLLTRVVSEGLIGGTETKVVDYAAVDLGPESDLSRYLESLAGLDLTRVPEDEGLPLLINAYNAFTVHLIASNLDGLTSITSLSTMPFPRTTWNTRTFQLGGMSVTLDDVEHGNIRGGRYSEPRIHAAVNCASVSCPDLRPEAYTAADLEQQLEEQMISWINNPNKGMRLHRPSKRLYLSALFKWYGSDFEPLSVAAAACKYNNEADACKFIEDNDVSIMYMDYNWDLNSLEASGSAPVEPVIKPAADAGPHAGWDVLLKRVVSPGRLEGSQMNVVDYSKLDGGNDPQLQAYMAWLATADINNMTVDEQLATLINAYNAFTLLVIAENYDNGGLKSILDLENGVGPWDARKFQLGGQRVTLNQIENGWIRGQEPSLGALSFLGSLGFSEPRIHAAVNCAAISCPDLRAEAYTAARLNQQLEEQMEIWLNDDKGLRFFPDGTPLTEGRPLLMLSSIFKWYRVDFVSEASPNIWDPVCKYHTSTYTTADGGPELSLCEFLSLAGDDLLLGELDYNWDLNHAAPAQPAMDDSTDSQGQSSDTVLGGSISGGS